jgi:chemotaxis protein MotB
MAEEAAAPKKKCDECKPGLPAWMATFTDMITLLMTFFVLLLSMAKQETSKFESALGSIRQAFGGNVLNFGPTVQPGKSPDNQPVMSESQEPARPFPIEFLSSEGLLDKLEQNRASEESLRNMRSTLGEYELNDLVDVYEENEGIKVRIKDKIYFKEGTIEPNDVKVEVYEKLVQMLRNEDWVLFIEGHASRGEVVATDRKLDALMLSSMRAQSVSRSLIARGVRPNKITTIAYGDTRPESGSMSSEQMNRRVEFMIRKRDLRDEGRKVPSTK